MSLCLPQPERQKMVTNMTGYQWWVGRSQPDWLIFCVYHDLKTNDCKYDSAPVVELEGSGWLVLCVYPNLKDNDYIYDMVPVVGWEGSSWLILCVYLTLTYNNQQYYLGTLPTYIRSMTGNQGTFL